MTISRRSFIKSTGITLGTVALAGNVACQKNSEKSFPDSIKNLKPMTGDVIPVTLRERVGRIEKAKRSLEYFTPGHTPRPASSAVLCLPI